MQTGKDPSAAKSFRPISLLCHTYKLFERLILNRIAEHVDAKLIPEQAGFRLGKSCTSQLLNLTEHIKDGYKKRLITGAVFVDLFSCVRHGQPPTPPQQGARDDWRRTPDRPDTHHAGKQTLLRGAEREVEPLATTTKRTTTGKCTGTDVVQHRSTLTTSPYTPTRTASSMQTTCASCRKETTSTTSKRHARLP